MNVDVMQEKERRYIFNGEPRSGASGLPLRQNRRAPRRRYSTFSVILAIFGFGIAIVLYVNNILAVQELVLEVGTLESRLQEIQNRNEKLRAEISTKSSLDKLAPKAGTQLGLRYATEQPVYFPIDEELADRVK